MSLYTLIIVTFVIFMAINVIIGLRGRKHASTTKDFLTASGQSGIWFIKPTLVAAKGRCIGGSTAMFNAFDIRIVGEGFRMHDGDIYYGTVGSWGMSSLRLPMWIGRNKVLDYMFLNEDFTGRQCYELGLASKVVADELVEVVGLATAKKMSKAAPIAVKYYKDCVRKATQNNIEEARAFELKAAEIVFATEDSKIGLKSVVENHGVPNCEFYGR